MMKKILIIGVCLLMVVLVAGCSRVRRNTGRTYMPDMVYSRAYETYAAIPEGLKKEGATYTAMPVQGTVARGDLFPYTLKNDSAGYAQSAAVKNPLPALNTNDFLEASRLFLVNCGICHGEKLDGNGPLFKSGVYPLKPATLVGDPKYHAMPEGTMFHSITYGKNMMGSYASQLSTKQRWMIVHYIKEKQAASPIAAVPAAATDTTAKKGK